MRRSSRSVSRLPPWVVTRHMPSTFFASMAATTNCEPYFDAMASISPGSRTAALFTVTLSAPGVEQPACVRDRRDAASHGERNVDARRDARYQPGEGAAPLLRGADVEIHQLVGPFGCVFRAEFHRVADVFQLREVDPFDRLPLADVETGNYAFCKHRFSSSSVIRPS